MLAVSRPMLAQAPQPPVKNSGQPVSPPPGPENPSSRQGETLQLAAVVERIVARENQLLKNLRNYSPRIETYIQNFRPDPELGSVPTDDHYFLGRMDFHRGVAVRSFLPQPSLARRILGDLADPITRFYSMHYQQQPC